jgi:hypothetical protein
MKFTLDYEKEEYVELVSVANRLVGVFETLVNNMHKEKMARIKTSHLRTVSSMFESMDEDFSEEDSETIPFNVVSGGKESKDSCKGSESNEPTPDPEQPLVMSQYAKQGCLLFNSLVQMWLQGFDVEGAEQPPRAERCVQLTQSYEGRAIIHYLEYIRGKYPEGGLTYAIRDTGLVSPEQTRLLAENMTAVSSACRYTQFASYLEHPDPSQLEDFFNV